FVALPVLLLLTLSVLQFSLVFTAKNTLDQALFRGVRAATLDHGSLSALRSGAAQALAALYPNAQSGAAGDAQALAQAEAELALPNRFQVVVLNPTAAAIGAWDGPYDDQGRSVQEIPQAHLIDTATGPKGGETLQAANLLSVQGRWCQPLIVPFINTVIQQLMAPLASGWNAACYAQGGMPLIAQSTQLMQSSLYPANIQAALGAGQGAAGGAGAGGGGGGGGATGGGAGGPPTGGGTGGGGSGGSTGGTGNGGGSDAPPDHFCIGAGGVVQTGAGTATGAGSPTAAGNPGAASGSGA
ncbi:TadE/TadG family type IV pilus assembly protein, partial [Thiomonas arsenitoxydans]|uniref:TadE/TadG family type IV pilus assembly protein n=1 Tax=Thiomonas arsenitoxydans (strain DSM 22701 / CIP 110005 / 3As) TaxID=426114 RepID=UPI001AC3514E